MECKTLGVLGVEVRRVGEMARRREVTVLGEVIITAGHTGREGRNSSDRQGRAGRDLKTSGA